MAREYSIYENTEINWRVREGYGTLIAAYAAPLDIRRQCPATLVDHSGDRLRVVTPRGDIMAQAVVIAVPPTMMANEALRFAPAIPAKLAAAQALPLGIADKVFLAVDRPESLPAETNLFGKTTTPETGNYTFRPLDMPLVEGYFGGPFARKLEMQGNGAFAPSRSTKSAPSWATTCASACTRSSSRPGRAIPGRSDRIRSVARARRRRAPRLPSRSTRGCSLPASTARTRISPTAHGAYRTGVAAAKQAIKTLGATARA